MFNSLFSNCSPYEKGFTWNPFHFEAYSLWSWNPFHFEAYSLWSWNPFHFEAYSLWSLAGWIIDCIVKGLEKYYKIKDIVLSCLAWLVWTPRHLILWNIFAWDGPIEVGKPTIEACLIYYARYCVLTIQHYSWTLSSTFNSQGHVMSTCG